jgi:hypothetical protein
VCRCNPGYARVIDIGCQLCVPGKFAPITAISCVDCVAGKYADREGATVCQDCAKVETVNTATSPVASTAASQCVCEKGYSGSIDVSATPPALCQACAPGKFTASTGNVVCSNCPANSTTPPASTSQAACTCKPGYGGDAIASNCVLCAAGQYKSAGNGYCTHCDAGTYGVATGLSGQTSCTSCGTGKYGVATGQTAESWCMACAPGKFTASTGNSVCSFCEAGKYAEQPVAVYCINCGPGKYGIQVGASSESTCINCTAGSYSNAYTQQYNASQCWACEAGKFSNSSGSSLCRDCQPGQYGVGANFSNATGATGSIACHPKLDDSHACHDAFTQQCYTRNCIPKNMKGGSCGAKTTDPKLALGGNCCDPVMEVLGSRPGGCGDTCLCAPGYTGPSVQLPQDPGSPEFQASIALQKLSPASGLWNSVCELAKEGTYKDKAGDMAATPCPAGTYNPVKGSTKLSECLKCPANTNSPAGSTKVTDCTSSGGFLGPAGGPCEAEISVDDPQNNWMTILCFLRHLSHSIQNTSECCVAVQHLGSEVERLKQQGTPRSSFIPTGNRSMPAWGTSGYSRCQLPFSWTELHKVLSFI